MKNKHIDTYSTIYDVDIVIANQYVTIDELKEILTYSNDEELDTEPDRYEAYTSTCKYKDSGRFCILIKHNKTILCKGEKMRDRLINCAAHEATHAMIYLQDFSNQPINIKDSCEYLAYFMGWITQRIYDTWTKK